MAIIYCEEIMEARAQRGKYQETYEYPRAWLIRTDDPFEPMPNVTNAAGINYLDPYPDDPSCVAMEFETRAVDKSGLLYRYDVKYYAPPADAEKEEQEQPGKIPGLMKFPIWSGGSSSKVVPAIKDVNGDDITNSAGDPLEDLTAEISEPRLTLRQYYPSHSTVLQLQREYTDTVNDGTWNGGDAETWRCLGCSFQLQTENVAGVTYIYWEVTWEFAFDRNNWRLKPWDLGFAERCNSSGVPSASGDKRKTIVGQDGKTVKQPVALAGGVALPAGSPPQIINGGEGAQFYATKDFYAVFGQVFTPPVI